MPRPLISANAINRIRLQVDEAAMPDTISIVRTVRVSNGRGGFTETTTQIDYPCRWSIVRARTGEEGGVQVQSQGTYNAAMHLSADVKPTDTAIFHSEKYETVWTPEPSAYSTSRVVGLEFVGPVTPITDSTAILGVNDTILSIEV